MLDYLFTWFLHMTISSGHATMKQRRINVDSTPCWINIDTTLIQCCRSANLLWLRYPDTESYEFCRLPRQRAYYIGGFLQVINGSNLVPRSAWRAWLPAYCRLITQSWLYEYSDYFYESNLKVLIMATAILCHRRLSPLQRHQGAFYTVLKHRRKTTLTRIFRRAQQLTSYCSFVGCHKRNKSLAHHTWFATTCR